MVNRLEEYFNTSIDEISIDQIKDFLQYSIETKKVSVSFINQVISDVKILQHDIPGRSWESIRIKRPGMDKKLPVVLSMEEVKSMIETTRNLKHLTILAVTYSTGLRICQACLKQC